MGRKFSTVVTTTAITTIIAIIVVCTFAATAQASILFEGWFEVMLGAKKIGFSVQRYEFVDNKFKCVTYIKTTMDGKSVTESMKATTGPDLLPISYAYTSKALDDVKVIDATFKGDQMSLSIFDGKETKKVTKRLKKGTFLSDFLLYIILNQKKGLTAGNSFNYNAVAEEEGTAYMGSVSIKNQEPVKGKQAFRILNEFKGDQFFIWISTKGEPLLLRQPKINVDMRIADSQADATKDMNVNLSDLKLLFGRLPGDGGGSNDDTDTKPTNKMKKKPADKAKTRPPIDDNPGVEVKGVPPPSSSPSP